MAASAVSSGADRVPYVGFRPFRAEDADRFFGRSDESREVAALWRDNRVTVVSGRSGVGKTSLLQAGVIPLFEQSSTEVLPLGRVSRPTAFPVAALPEHNPHTLALLAIWSPGESETRLSGLTINDFLQKRGERTGPYGEPLPILAAIDQVEDLFTGLVRDDRRLRPFIDELAEALEEMPHLHLLLSVREDNREDLVPYLRELGEAAPALFDLSPFSPEAATQAVRAPLEGTRRWLTADAVQALVGKLRTIEVAGPDGEVRTLLAAGVEPCLLQVACSGLWAALPEDAGEVTTQHLSTYGDVDHVLADFCEHAVATVAIDYGIRAAELGSWLRQTFASEPGARGTAYEGTTRTAGMPTEAVRALQDWHILTAIRRSGSRWYELQSDCLASPIRHAREWVTDEATVRSGLAPGDYLQAAELAMADGDLALAERHASAALRAAEGKDLRLCAEAESLLGNVAHSRGRPQEAESHYRAAAMLFETLQDTPAVAGVLAAIGQSLLAQGKRAEAVDYLHAAVGRIPNDLTVQTEFAWALWHAGQQRAAVAVLTGVLAIDGSALDALRARGEILADLGDAEEALRDLDRIQRYQRPSTRAARGLALATLRRINAADPEIDAALSRAPDSGPVLLYAARVAALSRDPAIAANLARRAVSATDPAVPPHQREQALQLMAAAR